MELWWFTVPYSGSLIVLLLFERLLSAVLSLFMSGNREGKSEAHHVVAGALHVGSSLVFGLGSVVTRCILFASQCVLWFFIMFCLLSLLYVTYTEFPVIWIKGFDYYNSRVGPFMQTYVILPLQWVNILFKGVVPVWNAFVWFGKVLISKGLLPLVWEEAVTLAEMGVGVLNLGRHCSQSLYTYVGAVSCSGNACLTTPPQLDLITPMGDVRDIAVLGTSLLGNVCSVFAVPVEVFAYPLSDVNLAQAVHNLGNAVLGVLVAVPVSTYHRCRQYGNADHRYNALMCTPDLQPIVTNIVSGLRDLGELLDNWMGVGYVALQAAVTQETPACWGEATLGPQTFSSNNLLVGETATIGLTDWLMATSNSSLAYFFSTTGNTAAPRQWPQPIDVSLGVAAVTYAGVGSVDVTSLTQGRRPASRQSTTLLGCACVDSSAGLDIQCALLPFSGSLTTNQSTFSVWFQDDTWRKQLTCSTVEITVRSVRWQVSRYEGTTASFAGAQTDIPANDCVTRGTCENVDASIWVVPKCSLLPGALCSDYGVGTSCFPFCMAVRQAGTANSNPVLVNAGTWRTGKQLMNRNCGLNGDVTGATYAPSMSVAGTSTVMSSSGMNQDSPLFVSAPAALGCSTGMGMTSWVPKQESSGFLPFTRIGGQPFAIAGDTILIADNQLDGGVLVQVCFLFCLCVRAHVNNALYLLTGVSVCFVCT